MLIILFMLRAIDLLFLMFCFLSLSCCLYLFLNLCVCDYPKACSVCGCVLDIYIYILMGLLCGPVRLDSRSMYDGCVYGFERQY